MNMFILVPLVLLIPAIMFARWGYYERDRECYVLASIYLSGALLGVLIMFVVCR